MLLGDVLAAARHSAGRFQSWLEASDPQLAEAIQVAAAQQGLGPAAYVRMAIADFDRYASPDDWQTLTSHLRNSSDPGAVCLQAMVWWRLSLGHSEPAGPEPAGPLQYPPHDDTPEITQ